MEVRRSSDILFSRLISPQITLDIMPYAKFTNQLALLGAISRGESPGELDPGWLADDMKRMIRSCWISHPTTRPLISQCSRTARTVYLHKEVSILLGPTMHKPDDEQEVRELFHWYTELGEVSLNSYYGDGDMAQLHNALHHLSSALSLPIGDELELPDVYHNLGHAFLKLYELAQEPYHLEGAIFNLRRAYDVCSLDAPHRHMSALQLGNALALLYQRNRDRQTMSEALHYYRWALLTGQQDRCHRYHVYHGMVCLVTEHFLESGEAVSMIQSYGQYLTALMTRDGIADLENAHLDLGPLMCSGAASPLNWDVCAEIGGCYSLSIKKGDMSASSRCALGNLVRWGSRFGFRRLDVSDVAESIGWYQQAYDSPSPDHSDDLHLVIQLYDAVRLLYSPINATPGSVGGVQFNLDREVLLAQAVARASSARPLLRAQIQYRTSLSKLDEYMASNPRRWSPLKEALDAFRLTETFPPVEVGLNAEQAANKYILQLAVALFEYSAVVPGSRKHNPSRICPEVLQQARRRGCNERVAERLEALMLRTPQEGNGRRRVIPSDEDADNVLTFNVGGYDVTVVFT